MLSGVINRPRLANHRHADLAWIGKLLFDALDHLVGDRACLFVSDLIRSNEDAYLAAGLHGVDLLDAFKSECDLLQVFKPTEVCLTLVATCARSCGADRVCDLHDWCLASGALHLLMVRSDRVDDPLWHTVSTRQIGADRRVRTFDLVVERLTNVMEQPAYLCGANVHAKLAGDSACDLCGFN
jgi:hypothetical protein